MHSRIAISLAMFLLAACAHDSKPATQEVKKADAPQAPTEAEMKAMMEMYEQAAMPGEPHKILQKLVGKWTSLCVPSAMPGMPAESSKGTSECRAILGGRQCVEESETTAFGKPFKGIFIIGYDNTAKEYVSTWTDSFSTGQYQTRGTADATGKVITMKGVIRDAMSPVEPRPWQIVMKIESDDHHVVEIYDTVAPEQLAMVMSVTSTRVK